MIFNNCPICDHSEREIIITLDNMALFEGVVYGRSSYDQKSNQQFISVCLSCGHIYNAHHPDVQFLEHVYFQNYSAPFAKKGDNLNRQNLFNERIESYLSKQSEIQSLYHDMCNEGGLLHYFKNQGYKVLGNEQDERLLAVATESSLDVKQGNIYSQKSVLANLFISRGIFEHVSKPLEYLRKIKEIIGTDGHICLEFPLLDERIENVGAFQFINAHVSYFTIEYVKSLFSIMAFEITEMYCTDNNTLQLFAQCLNNSDSFQNKSHIPIANINKQTKLLSQYQLINTEFYKKVTALIEANINKKTKVAFFGAGGALNELLCHFPQLKSLDHIIVDNAAIKHGFSLPLSGTKIESPKNILNFEPNVVVISSASFGDDILKELKTMYQEHHKSITVITLIPSVEMHQI